MIITLGLMILLSPKPRFMVKSLTPLYLLWIDIFVPGQMISYFSMNMDRAGANADCYSMLERNENWIEDWFEADPDAKGKK